MPRRYEDFRRPFEPPVQLLAALGTTALGEHVAEHFHASKNIQGFGAALGFGAGLLLTTVANSWNVRQQAREQQASVSYRPPGEDY